MPSLDSLDKSITIIGKIADLFKKNGYVIAFFSILIFGLVLGGFTCYKVFNINHEFTEIIKEQNDSEKIAEKNEHEAITELRVDIKPKVDEILDELLIKMDCNRCYVVEMHNGNNNPTGLPFIYGEMTYEESTSDVDDIDEEYMSVNLSRYRIPQYMRDNKLFIGSIESFKRIDPKLGKRLEADDVTYVAMMVIDGLDSEIGLFGISYCNGKVPKDSEYINKQFITYSQRLSTYLDLQRHK